MKEQNKDSRHSTRVPGDPFPISREREKKEGNETSNKSALVLDVDDLIYKTREIKKRGQDIFPAFHSTYQEAKRGSGYDLKRHAQLIEKEMRTKDRRGTPQNSNKIQEIKEELENTSFNTDLVDDQVVEAVREIMLHQPDTDIILLSAGQESFQAKKIALIRQKFSQYGVRIRESIIIPQKDTAKRKAAELEKLKKKYRQIVFTDDDLKNIQEVRFLNNPEIIPIQATFQTFHAEIKQIVAGLSGKSELRRNKFG